MLRPCQLRISQKTLADLAAEKSGGSYLICYERATSNDQQPGGL